LTPAGPLLALLGCLLMNWAASSVMMFFIIRMMKRIIECFLRGFISFLFFFFRSRSRDLNSKSKFKIHLSAQAHSLLLFLSFGIGILLSSRVLMLVQRAAH